MPNTLDHDLLSGVKDNYYRCPDETIVKIFEIEFDYDTGQPSHFRASIVQGFQLYCSGFSTNTRCF